MAIDIRNSLYASTPFEGPEKLLEVWFAPSAASVQATHSPDGRVGLRKIPRRVWEDMLDIVKCKVLSVIEGDQTDAYLLSESSLFVFAHRIILKTCGTTLNLLGLPRILDIARNHASFPSVYQCFYSRKSFMFPECQPDPHREWKDEVAFLDAIFPNGAAYTVGKVNADHWLLYITTPAIIKGTTPDSSEVVPSTHVESNDAIIQPFTAFHHSETSLPQDYTIEILMSDLSREAREPFFFSVPPSPADGVSSDTLPSITGQTLSAALGISDIFPQHITTLDAYAFSPCGYSSNALIKWGDAVSEVDVGEGYYTIHVTPEEGWSYASFECNVPLSASPASSAKDIPDLRILIKRVVDIFQPRRLSLTLFISNKANSNAEEDETDSVVEAAQREFKYALTAFRPVSSSSSGSDASHEDDCARSYRRTDKINYEFGGYNLAFASFELR
ncbi:S-adenosylmethionine decarboxylase [Boletus edulis]|uniref:adenosylmethionine decarboxylase n=1 Tax=Boletus edulis BED1 TaxID=1328754 RepID=A0AAD4BL35_BOLED|nr:S-adenosylmethionine decarboxylase [Boletus edulis]KAF8433116.1 S-adenosylmethionine decarboxylase [Boletus edulis BED1]